MSILIKGAKMPSCCFDCIFRDKTWDECKCPPTRYYGILSCLADDKRASFCPLVELPEKHGDLVDASALLKEFELARKSADMDGREYANAFRSAGGEISTEWWAVEDMVENAAVVVEAEGEDEDGRVN